MITITRRIQINPIGEKDERNKTWTTIREWNEQVFRAANTAASHLYFQNNMKEFFYLTNNAKILFADINKEPKEGEVAERVLNTSKQNTTYQVLSSNFKGKMPSDIYSNLNAQLVSTFSKESKEYFSGKRSLRTYKRDMPIPFSKNSLRDIEKVERDYNFSLFGLKFRTYFGRDSSGNETIFDRAMSNEYKFCSSSIQIKDKKMFLLAVFQFEKEDYKLDIHKQIICSLHPDFPIIIKDGKKEIKIGSKQEYLHRRIAIRNNLRNLQQSLKHIKGGKGRTKKLQALNKYKDYELNYINTQMHVYSRELINYCLKNKIGTIILDNFEKIQEEAKKLLSPKTNEPLLRSWSFSNLSGKIAYKAKKYGIDLIINEKIILDEKVEQAV